MKLDPRESLAQLVLRVLLALLEKREREEPEENQELLDPLGLQEREELLVTGVSQVRMVSLVLRVRLVIVVFLELLGLKVPLVTLDAQGSQVFLEPEVLLDVLEMQVLRAKLDLVECPEKMVAQALLVLWEPVDNQELWDSPDQKEPMVNPENQVKKVLWVVLV